MERCSDDGVDVLGVLNPDCGDEGEDEDDENADVGPG
jgi:hypothetical protein